MAERADVDRAAPTPPPFEAVTFNVRNGFGLDGANSWPWRRRATAEALRTLDADLIGLQEVHGFQLRYLQRRLPGYRSVGDGRGAGRRGERCPLLARSVRFELVEHQTYWYGDDRSRSQRLPGASAPRIATIARFRDRLAERTLRVANTHLDEHHADNRARSAEQLAGWLDGDEPTVLLGDLNTGTEAAVFEALRTAGLHPVLEPGRACTAHGYRDDGAGPHLDHILVTEHLRPADASVEDIRPGGRFPSDHRPVRARLRWRHPI